MKIDWDYWEQMLLVDLRDAVALSLGIDPDNGRPESEGDLGSESELQNDPEAIRPDVSIYPGGLTWVDKDYDERLAHVSHPRFADVSHPMESKDFLQRLRFAKAHAANEMLQTQDGRVWLSTFAHWALSVKWNIPDELAKLAKPTGDEALQQRANELAAKLKGQGVADPTRRAVAKELAKSTPGKSEERIERIIRKQW